MEGCVKKVKAEPRIYARKACYTLCVNTRVEILLETAETPDS